MEIWKFIARNPTISTEIDPPTEGAMPSVGMGPSGATIRKSKGTLPRINPNVAGFFFNRCDNR